MSDLSSLFVESERFIDFAMVDLDKLLEQEGILSCSKTLSALDIDRRKAFAMLRKEANKQGGEEAYFSRFGLKKYGSTRWFVHMPTFKGFVDEFKRRFPVVEKPDIQKIAPDITRAEFFKMDGLYLYRSVMAAGFLPFDPDQLIRQVISKGLSREITGVWKEGSEFVVDFKVFLAYLYALKESISVEKARDIVEKLGS